VLGSTFRAELALRSKRSAFLAYFVSHVLAPFFLFLGDEVAFEGLFYELFGLFDKLG
jgi:hypothetical protein